MEPFTDEELEEMGKLGISERDMMGYISGFFSKRELRLIRNCCDYAYDDPAGLPGHNLMMLVSKIVRYHGGPLNIPDMLDEMIEMANEG